MGYRSDIVIGTTKEALTKDLLDPCIPKCLKEIGYKESLNGEYIYFFIEQWKWYEDYPEVQEILRWFHTMSIDEYGAIRIGEDDDDTETWGTPYEFEIHVERAIHTPVLKS